MSLLHTASFKEFGSLVCLWHDVKLRKMQLEVRSIKGTWRRDLWCHRVIVFFKCVKLLAEQLWQIWRRYAPPFFPFFFSVRILFFFRYLRKTWGGGADNRPPAVRGLKVRSVFVGSTHRNMPRREEVFRIAGFVLDEAGADTSTLRYV